MVHHIKLYKKIQQIDIKEARHKLTRMLKLDMWSLNSTNNIKMVHYYEGRMMGLTEAYRQLGIIDMKARELYIRIIVDAAWNKEEAIINEV